MKQLFTLFALGLSVAVFAQNDVVDFSSRSDLNPDLAPFYHGVASGDPMADRVIIWTRLTTNESTPQDLNWRMATDTLFTDIVATGTASSSPAKDWTVKVDITGLNAATWYYYDFEIGGDYSLIGRTRTAPEGSVDHARFAVLSCSSYEHGYFNAYNSIVQRNDVDAVLHLGDYIYEYEAGGYTSSIDGRNVEPGNEIISLSDYRTRYSHYRLDPDLMYIHQQFPFINVWDDHETANNSYNGGAGNHTEGGEGAWTDRMAAGSKANDEWLPIRKPDPADSLRIFRDFEYGDLLDMIMLDTRLYGRDEQGSGTDSARSLLGDTQRQWFYEELQSSTAKWKLVGQQVMMAPLTIFGTVVNNDQWDGYPAERDSLYSFLADNNIDNMVVLTGDIHTAWANDLPLTDYDPATGTNSAGVEFVVTSVTSPGIPIDIPIGDPAAIVMAANPHMKYVNLTQHGYMVLDMDQSRVQGDWVFVSTLSSQQFNDVPGESWMCNDGDNHFTAAANPNPPIDDEQPLAPSIYTIEDTVVNTLISENYAPVIVSAYPNPFMDRLVVQFNIFQSGDVTIRMQDMAGRVVYMNKIENVSSGLSYLQLNADGLATGLYSLSIETADGVFSVKVSKQ
ncbi:MAG: alkaline phosphatase D [Bacteroidia bacterium]|jgi:alkaline phosphatase D